MCLHLTRNEEISVEFAGDTTANVVGVFPVAVELCGVREVPKPTGVVIRACEDLVLVRGEVCDLYSPEQQICCIDISSLHDQMFRKKGRHRYERRCLQIFCIETTYKKGNDVITQSQHIWIKTQPQKAVKASSLPEILKVCQNSWESSWNSDDGSLNKSSFNDCRRYLRTLVL